MDAAVDLQLVVVDDGHEAPELLMGGEHGRLPHLTLLALAIAEHREDEAVLAGQAQAGRKARGHGKSLAERASGHLHAGQQVGIGMPLQARAELAQGVQLVDREEAGVGQRRIERRRRMPLGQDEPVAAGLVRVGRVVVHDAAEVQRREDIGAGERPARVPAARFRDHGQNILANVGGLRLQGGSIHKLPFPVRC